MTRIEFIGRLKLKHASNRQIARSMKVDEGTIRHNLKQLKAIAEYSARGGDVPADEKALADVAAEYSAAFPLAPGPRPRPTPLHIIQRAWARASPEEQHTILAWMQATIWQRHGDRDADDADGA